MLLFVHSWVFCFSVLILVLHRRHFSLPQSWPCHGSDLWSMSTSLIPAFSTILIFIPVCFASSCSANFNLLTSHLGKFPKDYTKSSVTFLVLVRGKFSLYHLKAYVYSFILSRDSKFWVPPSGLKLILSQFSVWI